jgi:hypothetical protein
MGEAATNHQKYPGQVELRFAALTTGMMKIFKDHP